MADLDTHAVHGDTLGTEFRAHPRRNDDLLVLYDRVERGGRFLLAHLPFSEPKWSGIALA
jgi:hypothetical protein